MSPLVSVAVDRPLWSAYTYAVPDHLAGFVGAGMRVRVPLGAGWSRGVVLGPAEAAPDGKAPRAILGVVDERPLLCHTLLELARWMSEYYVCPLGEVLGAFVPRATGRRRRPDAPGRPLAVPTPEPQEPFPPLTAAQQAVAEAITPALSGEGPQVHLVWGVTGSGKTEVYLHLMRRCLAMDRTALLLLPEIALTVPLVEVLRARFGSAVALLHSGLAPGERYREWVAIREGLRRIVVGARSAVFAPLRSPGLFVVDEESEPSYKQAERPHYHARDVALERARIEGAAVVLGSATPSLESWHLARTGVYALHRLTERFNGQPLPQVRMLDTTQEYARYRNRSVLSTELKEAVASTLAEGGQVLLFVNRRGHSPHVHCPACGFVLGCPDCSVALTYHQQGDGCVCHVCGRREPPPGACPECGDEGLRLRGTGTQKVEEEFAANFPGVPFERMDSDTTGRAGAHRRIIESIASGRVRVLIGTQMVAKGFDFKGLDLVGVVDADSVLHLPDFRAAERTFQLVTQVAGRVGRGERPGRVLVQTHAPRHCALEAARGHDFEAFAREEIPARESLFYPPFSRLILVLAQSRDPDAPPRALAELGETLQSAGVLAAPMRLLGPSPARVARAHGLTRFQILIKVPHPPAASRPLREALKAYRSPRGVTLTVDVDPLL